MFRYDATVEEVVDLYATYYGPINRALAALDETGQAALRADLVALWTKDNVATDGTVFVNAELIEVEAIKK